VIVQLETWEYEYASTIGIRRYTNNWGKPDAPYYNPLKMEDNKKEGLIIFGVVPVPKEFKEVEILGWIPAQEGWDKGVEAQYGKIIPRSILYPVEDYNG